MPSRATSTALPPPAWIISAGALARLEQAGLPASILRADFDRPATLLIASGAREDHLVPRASLVEDFTSAAALAGSLRAGRVPTEVHYLLLDIERWPLTPPAEQRAPITAAKEALAAAHAYGKRLVFTPALDLMGVLERDQPMSEQERLARFGDLVVAPGATASDIFEVQSQQTEGTPYASSFAPKAIATATSAHPGEEVFAGLSTDPGGRKVSPTDLLSLYRAAEAAGVAGYWLNVPGAGRACPACGIARPRVAVAFLELIPARSIVGAPDERSLRQRARAGDGSRSGALAATVHAPGPGSPPRLRRHERLHTRA